MTAPARHSHVNSLLLDIEGTTTPVDFVYRTLFPYARAHLKTYLTRQLADEGLRSDLALLREQHAADARVGLNPPPLSDEGPDLFPQSLLEYAYWLMDRDSKVTPLKSLQGKIWEDGYRSGQLRAEVYDDVPPALERWRGQGVQVNIFSSGSVLAQRLLFAHTTAGDLTEYIRSYFDTSVGHKTDPASYRRIATLLGRSPSEILFISDVSAELDAALGAEMRTALCLRGGNPLPPGAPTHPVIHTFDAVLMPDAPP